MTSNGYYFKSEYNLFDRMVELCPEDYWQWDQKVLPYTKYVDKEHPGCPVGCVGLATTIKNIFIRCNWGEGNAYNGYYNGDVFWYNWHKYGEAEYLAVEKTRELKKN